MSTLSVPLQQGSPAADALRTGLAFAATVAIFYALCTLVWVVAQGAFLGFMNNLFHGMDFTALLKDAAFSWGGFIEVLLVMSAWAFLAGTFFEWLRRRIGA
jgi:hypothetical protein